MMTVPPKVGAAWRRAQHRAQQHRDDVRFVAECVAREVAPIRADLAALDRDLTAAATGAVAVVTTDARTA